MSARTVGAALLDARQKGVAGLDAQVLLAGLLGRSRSWVLAHPEVELRAADAMAWTRLVERRANGEPLAYLTAGKEFHGLALEVDTNVLVPRPETELLVDLALELLRPILEAGRRPEFVDLGTGSGAVALAVKASLPSACVHASELSHAAREVAARNARRLGLEIELRGGSWWEPWTDMQFDVAVSNPPYVASGDPHLLALSHEPAMALVGGQDGLDALRDIVAGARSHLTSGGWLLLEHGFDQAEAVRALLGAECFVGVRTCADLAGHLRCSLGHV